MTSQHISLDKIIEIYDIEKSVAEKALDNIQDKSVLFLSVSGKIGAGKDTVAPKVLERLGYEDATHQSFASPLRHEVNQVIEIIHSSNTLAEAMTEVGEKLKTKLHRAVVEELYEDVQSGIVTSSYQRTPSTRFALQQWGTQIRRAEDNNYWVKKAVPASLEVLASGYSVYITDSRFPNEADSIVSVGGSLVRLFVDKKSQRERIFSRDGIIPTDESLSHDSETAMDDYQFEITVDTVALNTEETINDACHKLSLKNKYIIC